MKTVKFTVTIPCVFVGIEEPTNAQKEVEALKLITFINEHICNGKPRMEVGLKYQYMASSVSFEKSLYEND